MSGLDLHYRINSLRKDLIYEVNLRINQENEKQFIAWLKPHIKEVVRKGNFISAKLFREVKDNSWTVQYLARDQKQLDFYLEHLAALFRSEAPTLFEGKFTCFRRIFQLEEEFI